MKTISQSIIYFIIGTLVCFHSSLFAQDIKIHLSILDESTTPSDTLAPYLQIEYINNSKHKYYFPALFPFDKVFPFYSSTIVLSSDSKGDYRRNYPGEFIEFYRAALFEEKHFQGNHYYLPLGFLQLKDAYWELITKDVYLGEDEHEEDIINYYLSSYTDYQHNREKNDSIPYYDISFLKNPKKLINSHSFVFLKGNESVTQLVSLSAIRGTGIVLTVCLSSCFPPIAMNTGWGEKRFYYLPNRIYHYHLYKGAIESNIITKEF